MTLPIEPVLDRFEVEYNPDRDRNQQVRCPFHDDTHASASVNLEEGLFNCFTCDVSGDGIALLMNREGMDFREAQRIAEELAGGSGRQVRDGHEQAHSALPRRKGSRPGRRAWVSPWSRKRS